MNIASISQVAFGKLPEIKKGIVKTDTEMGRDFSDELHTYLDNNLTEKDDVVVVVRNKDTGDVFLSKGKRGDTHEEAVNLSRNNDHLYISDHFYHGD